MTPAWIRVAYDELDDISWELSRGVGRRRYELLERKRNRIKKELAR